jgi:pimeloyl-ACP methyl ester carboxylesterase
MLHKLVLLPSLLLAIVFVCGSCQAPTSVSAVGHLSLGEDQIHYQTSGRGFPLVLVSGGSGMDLRQWDQVATALSSRYRLVLYDPRGIGQSDNPSVPYADTQDLAMLLDHLQLEEVVVIGLSSAGGFVLEFAVEHPQRVLGVVAAAPFVPGFEFSAAMLARLEQFNLAAQEGREPFLDGMFADPHFIPAPLHPSVREMAREIMAENFDKGATFDPSLVIASDPPLIQRLSQVEPPVLLLAGELDHPEVLRRNKFLLREIPDAREKIIPRAGHNTPLENPAGFVEAIEPFLEQLQRN